MGRRIRARSKRRTNRRSNLRKVRKNTMKRRMRRNTMRRRNTMKRRRNTRRNFRWMGGSTDPAPQPAAPPGAEPHADVTPELAPQPAGPIYSNWGHTLKDELQRLSDDPQVSWVSESEGQYVVSRPQHIKFKFNDSHIAKGKGAESKIQQAAGIRIDSFSNLPKLKDSFLEKCNELKDEEEGLPTKIHGEKTAVIFADPGKNDVDDLPATLALIKNFGEVLLFDCSGKNEFNDPSSLTALNEFAAKYGTTLTVNDYTYGNNLKHDFAELNNKHIECFLLCAFSDDKTHGFIYNYLIPYLSNKEHTFNFNVYGDVNPDIAMGDPISELNLNGDKESVERLMDFLLNSTLQTHNIGSNLRAGAKYYAVNAPEEESGRPARNYGDWTYKGKPGYNLEIVSKDPSELEKYLENRQKMVEIVDLSDDKKNYDYDKSERFRTNYPEVDGNTNLGLHRMLSSGAFPNTFEKNSEVINGTDKKDLADLSFVLSFLYGGDEAQGSREVRPRTGRARPRRPPRPAWRPRRPPQPAWRP